jgi:hypothetical protein
MPFQMNGLKEGTGGKTYKACAEVRDGEGAGDEVIGLTTANEVIKLLFSSLGAGRVVVRLSPS